MQKALTASVAFVVALGVAMLLVGFIHDWDTQEMLHTGLSIGGPAGVVGAIAAVSTGNRSKDSGHRV